jgi:hypothetical protein
MNESLKQRLIELGLNEEEVARLEEQGLSSVEEVPLLSRQEIKDITGCVLMVAAKIEKEFAPVPVEAPSPAVDPSAEIPEGKQPSATDITGAGAAMGLPNGLAEMMFFGSAMSGGAMGDGMDVSGMIPVSTLVAGYNPKVRNMYLMFMGQLENALGGTPIVVINEDGSVSRELTVEYIEGLQEGRDSAEDGIYYDAFGQPHELIRVGVDAQSIYDADPLDSTRALQKSGMGIGRVAWRGVSLEVKQVAYYAVRTNEINPSSEADLNWLRDNMTPDAKRTKFSRKAPQAIAAFREAYRTGQLPMLRVMLTRGPRRKEVMPRRRSGTMRDLSGIGRPERDENEL